jgi:hypothetical protein
MFVTWRALLEKEALNCHTMRELSFTAIRSHLEPGELIEKRAPRAETKFSSNDLCGLVNGAVIGPLKRADACPAFGPDSLLLVVNPDAGAPEKANSPGRRLTPALAVQLTGNRSVPVRREKLIHNRLRLVPQNRFKICGGHIAAELFTAIQIGDVDRGVEVVEADCLHGVAPFKWSRPISSM